MKTLGNTDTPRPLSCFWLCAGLITAIMVAGMARDITRPFYGLHSWGEAHNAWVARSHVRYGLGYTRGFDTFAVGDARTARPARYLDHPQLFTLVNAAVMSVLGVNTWSLRLANIAATVIAMLLLLKILRGLTDDLTALLAALIFAIFPLTAYFGVNMWLYPLVFLALWNYLAIIGALCPPPSPGRWQKPLLAASLFLAVQMTWEGFFFAMAIGIHYVFHCIAGRKMPRIGLLAILVVAPISSVIVDFAVLAAGRGWDIRGIIDIYKWRSGAGERGEHIWSAWFARLWEFAVANFSLPALIVAIAYLTFGQVHLLVEGAQRHKGTKAQRAAKSAVPARRFPQFWIFLMPAVFQLFILKGTLWPHQYWERPLAPVIAIAAALGIRLLGDILARVDRRLAKAGCVAVISIIFIRCLAGTNYYYSVRWQPLQKLEMFETLKGRMPPDMALLSFEDLIIDQHPAKQASYRPEIAWYLDRDIMQATSLEQIDQLAATGRYPFYLVPAVESLSALTDRLKQRYKLFSYIPGKSGKKTPDGRFLEAGMLPYFIFDMRSDTGGN